MELSSQEALLLWVFIMAAFTCQAQNSPEDYLAAHNAARSEVGVGPMGWSATLESYAVEYSNTRAGDCELVHSRGPFGENIYVGWGEGYSEGTDGVRNWYDEKPYYDRGDNQCVGGIDCRHYTQMVWRDSVELGCARVECDGDGGEVFIACSYYPPGNVEGEWPY